MAVQRREKWFAIANTNVSYRKYCCEEHYEESDFYEVEECSSIFRKLKVDAEPKISINILPTIYFCENLNDVNDFPVGLEEVVEMNSAPFVLTNQYIKLSPTGETDTLDYALISPDPFDEHHVVSTPSDINNTPLSKNRTVFIIISYYTTTKKTCAAF
jgi:hypothetical protein